MKSFGLPSSLLVHWDAAWWSLFQHFLISDNPPVISCLQSQNLLPLHLNFVLVILLTRFFTISVLNNIMDMVNKIVLTLQNCSWKGINTPLHNLGTMCLSHSSPFSVSEIQPPHSTVSCFLLVVLHVLGWGGSDVQLKSTSDSSLNLGEVNQSHSCKPLRKSRLFPFHVLRRCSVAFPLPSITHPTTALHRQHRSCGMKSHLSWQLREAPGTSWSLGLTGLHPPSGLKHLVPQGEFFQYLLVICCVQQFFLWHSVGSHDLFS